MAVIRVDDLAGGYAPGTDAIADVTFALEPGTIAAVLGPNGGGKTTLFRALLGELPVRRGEVELQRAPRTSRRPTARGHDFPVSALDVVLMGAYSRTPRVAADPARRPRRRQGDARARRPRRPRRAATSARCQAASASAC